MTRAELLAALKAATAETQHEAISAAVVFARDNRWISPDTYVNAIAWAVTGAYESAALTLVPAAHFWSITMSGLNRGGYEACCITQGARMTWHAAPTPALALCIACLAARGEG